MCVCVFLSIAHNYNIFDCLTFCVSISISIFVLPFEWPQTLQALWVTFAHFDVIRFAI